jgi:hypothetical protein
MLFMVFFAIPYVPRRLTVNIIAERLLKNAQMQGMPLAQAGQIPTS